MGAGVVAVVAVVPVAVAWRWRGGGGIGCRQSPDVWTVDVKRYQWRFAVVASMWCGSRPVARRLLYALVFCLAVVVLATPASALDIGARSVKARPSAEYSPNTAWELGAEGCGVTIAVFDNGVDDAHPYLDGKVIAGRDTTATEPLQEQLFDNPQPLMGSHGTPVAGLAASHAGTWSPEGGQAFAYGEDELVGVAPCAWLVDVMFNDLTTDTQSLETNIVEAFEWAIAHKDDDWGDDDPSNDGIDIITMSWSPNDGTTGDDPISEAANKAVEAGIVVLGSMGNSGAEEYRDWGTPAAADLALGIGNIWNERTVDRADDVIRDSSTRGPRPDDGDDDPYEELKPDVSTPGHGVVGTGPSYLDGREYSYVCFGRDDALNAALGCEYSFSGTSAATPMTAGVVALMLSANPDLTPAEIKEILHQTAEPHPDQTPSVPELSAKYNYTYGYGMTDAYKAVLMATQWPGVEIGRDTDADGLRDMFDSAPRDPSERTLVIPAGFAPLGGAYDTDGDLIADQDDPAPLDPDPQAEAAVDQSESTPAPVAPLVVLGVLALLMRRRR